MAGVPRAIKDYVATADGNWEEPTSSLVLFLNQRPYCQTKGTLSRQRKWIASPVAMCSRVTPVETESVGSKLQWQAKSGKGNGNVVQM